MKDLIKILEGFDERRNNRNKEEWEKKSLAEKYEEIAQWFRPCAEQILCNGYFLVNGEYIIDLGAIELYYHEEEGDIKDPIMYHTNAHSSNSRIFELKNYEYPYFKFGSFNLHQSGVDVTFEKPKKYRASFLIRSYRILKAVNGKYHLVVDNVKYDNHSTHIFDDLFYSGLLLFDTEKNKRTTIEWVDEPKNVEFDARTYPRINVAEYQKDEMGVYIKDEKGNFKKDKADINDTEFQAAKKDALKNNSWPKYFKSSSKIYNQDMRPWQYRIKGIQEIDNSYTKYYNK